MADWLVLERYEGWISGRRVRLNTAQVIDDGEFDVPALLASGAALVRYSAAFATAVARYLESHDPDDQNEAQRTMMAVLEANGLSPREQSGVYDETGGAGARAITFARPFASAAIAITFGVEDTGSGYQTVKISTAGPSATGFTMDTGGNAKFHWRATPLEP